MAGTSEVARKVLDLVAPGLQHSLRERVVHARAFGYEVAGNHHLTRAFREAWDRAWRSLINSTLSQTGRYGLSREDRLECERISDVLEGVAAETNRVILDFAKGDALQRVEEVDRHVSPVLTMLAHHVLRETRKEDRTRLNDEAKAWLRSRAYAGAEQLPDCLVRAIEDAPDSDDWKKRGFAYLLLDEIVSYVQHPKKNPEAARSIEIALQKIQHQAVLDALDDVRAATGEQATARQLSTVRQLIADGSERIESLIEASMQRIIAEINADREKRQVRGTDISIPFDTAARSHDLTDGMPSVIVCAARWDDTWIERVTRPLQDASERLVGPNAMSVRAWHLDDTSLRTTLQVRNTWRRILHSEQAPHCGTVVVLDDDTDEDLAPDAHFEDELVEQGLFASPDDPDGAFFAGSTEPSRRNALRAAGAIRLTVQTRLTFETLVAGRPLIAWDRSNPATRDAWVDNLLKWLAGRGVPVITDTRRGHGAFWATGMIREVFDIPPDAVENPYLRLEHYTPEDSEYYRGRHAAVSSVRDAFAVRGDDERPVVLRIDGPSGVGKSSFMNVRVAETARKSGFDYVTFRPTDIMAQVGNDASLLHAMCHVIASQMGWEAIETTHPLIKVPNPDAARGAVCAWLDARLGPGKMLIAVDQFEEIIDNIDNGWNAEGWRALVTLLEELAGPKVALALTLESSRWGAFARLLPGGPLATERTVELDDDEEFMREVIKRPFADAGFRLANETVEELLGEARRYGTGSGEAISSLPLLTLKLHALFDSVVRVFSDGRGDRRFDLVDVPHEDVPIPLDIGSEIENLAQAAWQEEGGSDDDLDTFLRPFVRVVESTEEGKSGRMVLATVPYRGYHGVQKRQAAFEGRRLVVPAPGGHRLAHEAVIRRWSMGRRWFDRVGTELAAENVFLERAAAWNRNGRYLIEQASDDDIAIAASILGSRTVDWSMADNEGLDDAHQIELAFCLTLFDLADNPTQDVDRSSKKSKFIHLAATYDRRDLMTRFLDRSAEAIHLQREDGNTPLMQASWASAEMVQLLLDRGADPDFVSEEGWCALDSAIWGMYDEAFDLLVDRTDPAPGDPPRINALYSAARMGQIGSMRRLEAVGWRHDQPTKDATGPLIGAAVGGTPEALQYCLEAGGDPAQRTESGLNAFDYAAAGGRVDLMLLMLRHPGGHACVLGASDGGWTPLLHAATSQRAEAIRWLLAAQAPVDVVVKEKGPLEGGNALHCAMDWMAKHPGRAPRFIVDRTRDAVAALVEHPGIDVNLADAKGRTPWSMAQHHPSLRELIKDHPRFDYGKLPDDAPTPLDDAIEAEDEERIRDLLSNEQLRGASGRVRDSSSAAEKLVRMGLGDLVVELVREGHVTPWSARGGNLFDEAWFVAHQGLIDMTLRQRPRRLSSPELESILITAIVDETNGKGRAERLPAADLIDDSIARAGGPKVLNNALLRVGQLGSNDLYDRLVKAGADPGGTDDWGRTILERCADAVVVAKGGRTDGWPPGGAAPDSLDKAIDAEDAERVRELLLDERMREASGRVRDSSSAAEKLVRMGLGDLVIDLVREGHVSPWSPEGGNLFDEAWFADHQGLIDLTLERRPDRLSSPELVSVLRTALVNKWNGSGRAVRPPAADLIDDSIARADGPEVLNAALLQAGQSGSVDLYRKLVAAGANPGTTDDWGRTILERCADVVVAAEFGQIDGWPPGDGIDDSVASIRSSDRATLVQGDLDAIRKMLANWDTEPRRDDWARGAVDLVPDHLQAAVADLLSKN